MSYSFRVGHSTIGKILRETLSAIWNVLGRQVLKPPNQEEWVKIASEFETLWNFPNCIGAIDGKHIRIKCPPHSGSEYFNYKGYFSIVLLAVCDAHYRFILVDIGDSGRHSDGGILFNSEIGRRLESNLLGIPAPSKLKQSSITVPYMLVGDDAFPLKKYLMKPYPGRFLTKEKNIFNYRLSRARRVVENAFGILAVRWQIFYSLINCKPELAEMAVQASIVLHNYLQSPSSSFGDIPDESGECIPGSWRSSIPTSVNLSRVTNIGSNFYAREARFIRDELCQHFNTVGAVPWQWTIGDHN